MALVWFWLVCAVSPVPGQGTQPLVAVHDSELTRALESLPATPPTPSGAGTTGKEWWPTQWHYFVMPESVKETLRSDGTAFAEVSDSNITAGLLLLSNGAPRYPILISLASEAIRDDEIAPLTNYVAAGGFLLVGSSSFTRNTNGTTRGDFAFANALGIHMVTHGLTDWAANNTFTKANQPNHRLVSHIPQGRLTWRLPASAEEITMGTSPSHPYFAAHLVWMVQAGDATVLAVGDSYPFLLVKPFGKGYFIYHAPMQPLIGHGGFGPGTYAYVIFRRAVEWAFETANLPLPKLSPWPYPYNAAFTIRHDLENYTNEMAHIEQSAQVEYTNGAKGDYYLCTGVLRDDAAAGGYNTNTMIAGLRRAVTNYQATIGSHNGGLKNPSNLTLKRGDYDYWHWGPDEALDVTPPGYPSGKAYAMASISNSFVDIESWLAGVTNGSRIWVAPYFNATREDSYDILAQLGIRVAGEQKLSPFPHWTLSTRTPGKRYWLLSVPVNEWYAGTSLIQTMEGGHSSASMHNCVDFYYGLGALINMYSHTLSTGEGAAGPLVADYITYSLNTNLHPRLWSANAAAVYQWWLQRSNAQIVVSYATNGYQTLTAFSIMGATHTNTAVELLLPGTNACYGLQVFTNGLLAGGDCYRMITSTITSQKTIKLRIGTSVTNAVISYYLTATIPPAIVSISLSTGLATVTWSALVGNTYRLQHNDSLPDTNWSNSSPNIVAPGPTASATNAVGDATQRLYRVLLLL